MRRTVPRLLGAFVVSVAIVEGMLNLPGLRHRDWVGSPLGKGIQPPPGLDFDISEGFSVSRTNSIGLRGPEIRRRAPGELRIAVLGNSFTRGAGVAERYTFCSRLERSLRKVLKRPVTVINCGMPAFSMASILVWARRAEHILDPDLVVVVAGDEAFEGFLDGSQQFWQAGSVRRIAGQWKLVENDAPPRDRRRWVALLKSSQLLRRTRDALKQRLSPTEVARPAPPEPKHADTTAPSTGARDGEATGRTEWLVGEMARTLPGAMLVYCSDTDPRTPESDAERRVALACRKAGVPFGSMRSAFDAEYRRTRQPVSGFANTRPGTGHLNARGHALVSLTL